MNESEHSVRNIFAEALEISDSAQRVAFLDQTCGKDADLRREVEQLLQAEADAGKFLPDKPAATTSRSALQELADAAHPFGAIPLTTLTEKPGDRIGRYELLEKIGEGGCGVVYLARQETPVRRQVALKIIKLGMDTRQVIARFEAERQAVAMMDHPNIAKVFDAGATETPLPASGHPLPSSDEGRGQGEGSRSQHSTFNSQLPSGRPFFVMELVRGVKITDYCSQHQLATHARLELFIQVCQAVQHAHQKGIIHRDLKPSNILVAVNDGVPVPKVIDFGIAKATEGKLTDQTLFTAFEQFLGTPAYMSPEQAAMTNVDIDTRSDIYSLGVLLYELLTGTTPFDTKTLLASGVDELRRTIREKEPKRPSTRLTQELQAAMGGARVPRAESGVAPESRSVQPCPGARKGEWDDVFGATPKTARATRALPETKDLIRQVRGDLDWIVMKCLEKDRARRYATANGLAADIQRHLNNEPVVARPPSRLYEFQKTVRRHKVGFAAVAAVILALLLGMGALAYGLHRARSEREAARSISYASDMNLCWNAWTWSDYTQCRRLLAANVPPPGERDLRSFEWWYLSRLTRSDELFSFGDVRGRVRRFCFLPEGRLVAVAPMVPSTGTTNLIDFETAGAGLVFWDWKSRRLLGRSKIRGSPSDLAVSPDGKWIAAVNSRYGAQLLDGNSYQVVANLPYTNAATHLEFSPNGRILALRGQTNIYLVDMVSNLSPQILPAFENNQEKPAFSTDGRLLAFMLPDKQLGVWDVESRRLIASLLNADQARLETIPSPSASGGFMFSHAFSPDGRWLASGDWAGRVIIHDLQTGAARLIWHHQSIHAKVAFSPDGRLLASAALEGVIKLWEPASGKELATFQGGDSSINCIGFAPGGDYLLSGGKDGRIRVWDARNLPSPNDSFAENEMASSPELIKTQANVVDLAAKQFQHRSPNGRFLNYPDDPRPPPAARQDTTLEFAIGPNRALSPNARFLVDAATNGVGRIRDLEAASQTIQFPLAPGESIGAISPDGQLVATCFENGRLLVRAPRITKVSAADAAHGSPITALEFSPDGTKLATGIGGSWLRVWNSQDLTLLAEAQLPYNSRRYGPTTLAFAPRGTLVACAVIFDHSVLLLDLKTKRSRELRPPYGSWDTHWIAFSPDGTRLAATASFDRAAIYDCKNFRLVAAIGGNTDRGLGCVAFTPDGKRLALVSSDVFTLWEFESNRQLLEFPPRYAGGLDQIRFNPAGDRLVITEGSVCRVYSAPCSAPGEAVPAPAGDR